MNNTQKAQKVTECMIGLVIERKMTDYILLLLADFITIAIAKHTKRTTTIIVSECTATTPAATYPTNPESRPHPAIDRFLGKNFLYELQFIYKTRSHFLKLTHIFFFFC